MNILDLTKSQVLALKTAEDLFPNGPPTAEDLKTLQRKLRKKWHTDMDGGDKDVFQHLEALFTFAETKISSGIWGKHQLRVFPSESGDSEFHVIFLKEETLPGLGTRFEGKLSTTFVFHEANTDLAKNWYEDVAGKFVKFRDNELFDQLKVPYEDQFVSMSPLVAVKVKDGILMNLNRPGGYINLKDVITKFGPLDIKAVAWITTRLCGLVLLSHYMDIPNIGINLSSVYINPKTHRVLFLEGWEYSTGFGRKALGAPKFTLDIVPSLADTKLATYQVMSELIRAVAIRALGLTNPVALNARSDIPPKVVKWLQSPAPVDPLIDMKVWEQARDASFKREFVPLDITFNDVY